MTTVRIVCGICDENINKSNRVTVTCPYCTYEACRSCCETYVLGQPVAKCMNTSCGKEWSRKFLVSVFSKTFLNTTWKKHREKVLLDKEMALLPATQAVVEQEIQKEKIQVEIDEVEALIRELNKRKQNLIVQRNMGDVITNTRNARNFVRACPDSECRGFLSCQWKCGLCEQHTCSDCHVIIGKDRSVEHTCNPDELATAQLLDKDTKPCPKCSTGIFKIEGCDQMWCTQCHTAFDWRSGMIETHIHNPHFFEWQRLNGGVVPRAAGDVICGRELNHNFIPVNMSPHLNRIRITTPEERVRKDKIRQELSDIVRSLIHLQLVDMPKYRVDQVENNLELRVWYMRKKMDKETFAHRIQRDNKKHEKNSEIYQVVQMFAQTTTEIAYRLVYSLSVAEDMTTLSRHYADFILEVDGIVKYANECLEDIANTYGNKKKMIVLSGYNGSVHYTNGVLV